MPYKQPIQLHLTEVIDSSGQPLRFDYDHAGRITGWVDRNDSWYPYTYDGSFFATYKKELVHTRPWPDIQRLKTATFDWIETYYNSQRRHSTLGYLTPREYELGYRNISEIAA